METLRYFFDRKEKVCADVSRLERTVSNFTSKLNPGRQEKLLDIESESLKVYHVGNEQIYKPGLLREEIKTGNESVFIEFKNGSDMYHLNGVVDQTTGTFKFKGIKCFKDGQYRKVSLKKNRGLIRKVNSVLEIYTSDQEGISSIQ